MPVLFPGGHIIYCDPGEIALGGGYWSGNFPSVPDDLSVVVNAPYGTSGTSVPEDFVSNGWWVDARGASGITGPSGVTGIKGWPSAVFVVCGPGP
jgi:hypothetical protein